MSKALTNRNPTSTTNILLFITVIVIIYFVVKNKGGQYLNEEKWEIERDSKGFLTSIVVHRDAKQG